MKTLIVVGIIALIGIAYIVDKNAEKACEAKGGHIIEKSTVGTGIGTNGQVSVVPVSTSFCISADGRILE